MKSWPMSASRGRPKNASSAGLTSMKRNDPSCSEAGNGESQSKRRNSRATVAETAAAGGFGALRDRANTGPRRATRARRRPAGHAAGRD